MGTTRLHTIAPDLDAAIAAAPEEWRREAAWSAAQWAVTRVGLSNPGVLSSIATRELGPVDAIVVELDEQYFALQNQKEADQATQDKVHTAFTLARAANAVAFAAREEYVEAVYESGIAVDDWPALRELVLSRLA